MRPAALMAAITVSGCSDAREDSGTSPLGAHREAAGAEWGASSTSAGDAQVLINEVLAGASDGSSDWLELYNAGSEDVDISGWRLADDPEAPAESAWRIPADTWIEAGGYLVIYASDGNGGEHDGLHATFKCSKGGETIVLHDGGLELVDRVEVESLEDDQAFARVVDAATEWIVTDVPTKGEPN